MQFLSGSYKVVVEESGDNLINLVCLNIQTNECFRTLNHQLQKINIKTIEEAFKSQSKTVYHYLKQTQNTLILQIQIKIEFLPTISEIIILELTQNDQKIKNYQLAQIKCKIIELQKQISNVQNRQIFLKQHSGSGGESGRQYQKLSPGEYLFEINAFIMGYQQDYYDQYSAWNQKVEIEIKIKQNQQSVRVQKYQNYFINSHDSYEYPLSLTKIFKIQKQAMVEILINSLKGTQLTISSSNFIITRLTAY